MIDGSYSLSQAMKLALPAGTMVAVRGGKIDVGALLSDLRDDLAAQVDTKANLVFVSGVDGVADPGPAAVQPVLGPVDELAVPTETPTAADTGAHVIAPDVDLQSVDYWVKLLGAAETASDFPDPAGIELSDYVAEVVSEGQAVGPVIRAIDYLPALSSWDPVRAARIQLSIPEGGAPDDAGAKE